MSGAAQLFAAAALAALACGGQGRTAGDPGAPQVTIRGANVEVELARSDAEQVQGLSDRRELAWGRGMLFQYSEPRLLAFWMLRMHFPIDIVWIREGRLIGIAHRVPAPAPGTPPSELPRYGPGELADAVLEVPAGFAQAHGWQRGDRVALSPGAELP